VIQTSDLEIETAGNESSLGDAASDRILARVGQVTRALRDSMRELGIDRHVERVADAMPDTHDRLRYVANMTEQAAGRVLNAAELLQPLQSQLREQAGALDARWGGWYEAPLEAASARTLLDDTRSFLHTVTESTTVTHAQLMEIILAQDFQDLTGQVLRKINDIVSLIEHQLLSVLLDNIAPERRSQFAATAAAFAAEEPSAAGALLNGPQIDPQGCTDVVQDQTQVDDLLSSLGF
jgi:chemotaxis protein CheZ